MLTDQNHKPGHCKVLCWGKKHKVKNINKCYQEISKITQYHKTCKTHTFKSVDLGNSGKIKWHFN